MRATDPSCGGSRCLNPPRTRSATLDIGDLIASGAVQPASAIHADDQTDGWLLRTPKGPDRLRWYRNLLNAGPGAPDLTIDLKLKGVWDVYVQVRAVNGAAQDALPMAFELRLDDGSRREVVGAKGFPDYHYDTEILACHRWPMDGRKLVLHSLGKPVYLYGFRCVPSEGAHATADGPKVARWLATDHVTIVQEPDRHFAFPGAALLKNGDLAVVYREGTVHGEERTGKISLSRSTDGGRRWQPRVTVLDRPDVDDRDPSIFQMSDGTILLFSADCLSTSRDNGRTWSPPLATPVFGPKGGVEDEEGHIVYGGLRRVVQDHFAEIRRPGRHASGRGGVPVGRLREIVGRGGQGDPHALPRRPDGLHLVRRTLHVRGPAGSTGSFRPGSISTGSPGSSAPRIAAGPGSRSSRLRSGAIRSTCCPCGTAGC